jgi:enoyl-CoA hydratase/carnithine racemase
MERVSGPETIRTAHVGDVVVITLDRPARLNAWNTTMAGEMQHAIEDANRDSHVGAIVVTGQGRAFCAGADVAMLEERRARRVSGDPEPVGHGGMPRETDWVALCRRSKPLIAAVNGIAVGIGLTMVLPFDVIVASESAQFSVGFTKMGLLPELASSHFLVQRMGPGRASEFCLSGDVWDAAESAAARLVDRVVPSGRLLEDSLALARRIAANPRPQLQLIKTLLTQNASETDLELVQDREDTLNRTQCVPSPEHREAVAAFRERRAANFGYGTSGEGSESEATPGHP